LQLNSFDEITRNNRHIFLSPHFDDVVYSCGGTLGVQASCGLRPLVITVFAGAPTPGLELSPFATQIHIEGMGFTQAAEAEVVMTARRKEDANALGYLQADYLWLDYLDAIYRGTPAYYTSSRELIGGDINPGDLWIEKQLAQDLVTLHERLPDAVWYGPLGIGRHVDHQIVSSAIDHLLQLGANVKLYEDSPYVLNAGALDTRLQEWGGTLEPAFVEMSEMLHLRQEAAEMYTSQIELNFADKASMYQAMKNYTHGIRPVETVHLERYWTAR